MSDCLQLLSWSTELEEEKIEYLVDQIIPRQGVGLLMGKSAAGKSQLAIRLALCMATGEDIAGSWESKETLPEGFGKTRLKGMTLYIAGEGGQGIKGRILSTKKALTTEKGLNDNTAHLSVIPFKITSRLYLDQQIEEIADKVEQYRLLEGLHDEPVLTIIIDTLTCCFEINDENSNSEMQRLVDNGLRKLSERFNCFVLAIGHPSKSTYADKKSMRGASSFMNSIDVCLHLSRIGSSQCRKLEITKIRDGQGEGATTSFRKNIVDGAPILIPTDASSPEKKETKETKEKSEKKEKPKVPEEVELTEAQAFILSVVSLDYTERKVTKAYITRQTLPFVKVPGSGLQEESYRRSISRDIDRLVKLNIIFLAGNGGYWPIKQIFGDDESLEQQQIYNNNYLEDFDPPEEISASDHWAHQARLHKILSQTKFNIPELPDHVKALLSNQN